MTCYMRRLTAAAKAAEVFERIRSAELEQAAIESVRDRLTPLDERLTRLLATIPRAVQQKGLSISALQGQLRPKGRGHMVCHVGELGVTLRRLGWRRVRQWDGSHAGFKALWFPPNASNLL
jgi:hypothetical protein